MKRRMLFVTVCLIFIVGMLFTLVCCAPQTHTVRFDLDGGTGDAPTQYIAHGEKAARPDTPTREGYDFLGWYIGEEEWAFIGYFVTEDITLTAKWEAKISGGLQYSLSADKAYYTVIGIGTCQDSEVIIPDIYQGKPVTGIRGNAFYECAGITSITIPESVTTISSGAFSYCTGLKKVNIPSGITGIEETVFFACPSLESITIPEGVTSIGKRAFYGCSGLKSVKIPSSVTKIDEYAFFGCSGLKSVTIPDSVTEIVGGAFSGCRGLTSVVIGTGVERIEWLVFEDCVSLEKIYYTGSESQWNSVIMKYGNTNLENATCYFYCEEEPTTEGNRWHYADGVPTEW